MLDGCFRVKRYKVSSEEKDPIIDNGWGFFVEESGYKEQLKKYVSQKAVSSIEFVDMESLTNLIKGVDVHRPGRARSRRHKVQRGI